MKKIFFISFVFILTACSENDSHRFNNNSIEEVNIWNNFTDTLTNGLVISFEFPSYETDVYRDGNDFFIESKTISHDNTNKLGIFLQKITVDKLDSLIFYNKNKYDFEVELRKDSIVVNGEKSLRVEYINKNTNSLQYRIVYFVKKDVIFEILDCNSDPDFYKKIINSISIK